MYYCEKCKTAYNHLDSAQECCGLHKLPCGETTVYGHNGRVIKAAGCPAKNFCQNKNPSNPVRDGSTAGQKIGDDLWNVRNCIQYDGPKIADPMTDTEKIEELQQKILALEEKLAEE